MLTRSIATLLVTGMFSWPAWAGSQVKSFGPEQPVGLKDFRPHLSGDEMYSEEWNHNVYLPDGRFIAVDFAITNAGMGDHKGAFSAKVVETDGSKSQCRRKFDSDEWSYDKKGFALKYGPHSVRGDLKGLQLKVRCKDLSMDLNYKNLAPPYQPGQGRLVFADSDGDTDGVFGKVFTSPRAQMTGLVRYPKGTIDVQAIGFAEHSYYDLGPHKYARRWFRFKNIDSKITITMAELESPDDYGGARNGWILVYGPDGRILASTRVRFVFDGFIQDDKSSEGYRIPRRVRIAAVDGRTQMTGQLLMKKLSKVTDPTEDLDFVTRSFFRRFVKPRDYHIDCSYKFQIATGDQKQTLSGDGTYRFFYVNP